MLVQKLYNHLCLSQLGYTVVLLFTKWSGFDNEIVDANLVSSWQGKSINKGGVNHNGETIIQ